MALMDLPCNRTLPLPENIGKRPHFSRKACLRPPEFRCRSGDRNMIWIANLLVAVVAALHVCFLALEGFLWTKPLGLKTFRNSIGYFMCGRRPRRWH
jgi:hypothetical protein